MNRLLPALRSGDWLTEAQLKRWVIPLACAWLLVVAADAFDHTRLGLISRGGQVVGRDFINYWSAARLALQGRADLAYWTRPFLAFQQAATGHTEFKWYGYPPMSILLALPLGLLPMGPALVLWDLAGVLLLTRLLQPALGWTMAALTVMAAPMVMTNIVSGQNGAFSAAILAGGLMLLDRRPVLSGLVFGLLCYKPQLAVLLPVALVAGGRWRTAFAAGASVLTLAGLSVALFGVHTWTDFLHNAPPFHRRILETMPSMWPRMWSVYTMGRQLGLSSLAAYGLQAASSVAAAGAVAAIWRGGGSTRMKGAALLVAIFLVTPYAWDYDLVALLFSAVWVWREAAETGWRPWEKTALALMAAAPVVSLPIALSTHLQPGPIVLWLVLALLTLRARSHATAEGRAPVGVLAPASV